MLGKDHPGSGRRLHKRRSSIFEDPPAEEKERGEGGNRQNSAEWRRNETCNFKDLAHYLPPLVVIGIRVVAGVSVFIENNRAEIPCIDLSQFLSGPRDGRWLPRSFQFCSAGVRKWRIASFLSCRLMIVSADYTISMFGFDFRQGTATRSITCLDGTRTGGALQPATTDAPIPSSQASASLQ